MERLQQLVKETENVDEYIEGMSYDNLRVLTKQMLFSLVDLQDRIALLEKKPLNEEKS
jgi:hypothetical protein